MDPVGPFQTRFHGQKALCVWGALVQIVQISWDLGQHLDVNNFKMEKEKTSPIPSQRKKSQIRQKIAIIYKLIGRLKP